MVQTYDRSEVDPLISQKQWDEVAWALSEWAVPEVADLLGELPEDERVAILRFLPWDTATDVFLHLDREVQRSLARALDPAESRRYLHSLPPDDLAYLLENLPADEQESLMHLLYPDDRRTAMAALGYPEESVGRLMSPSFVSVHQDWTVRRALDHLRKRAPAPETISNVYVTDREGVLVDTVELSRLVLADPATPVERLMGRQRITLSPEQDREDAVEAIKKYDLAAVPVVDDRGVLIGVVTVDDVIDVAEAETTEDIHRQAAVAPLKAAYPYVGVWELFRKRIPWLCALLIVYFLASGIISGFEQTLAGRILLASFIPLLMGSGGNVGSQAAMLTVRALATGELRGRLWIRAVFKEIAVGAGLGVTLGLLAGLIGHVRGGTEVALIVAAAMLVIVVTANLFGILLPLVLAKLGVDPAVAANPVITSVTDLTSLLIYFAIATRYL